jgi:hypothetical protein
MVTQLTAEDIRKKYSYATDLSPFPEIAALIGRYTASFATAEIGLYQVYGIVLGMSEHDAMILLGAIQSFTARLEAVERLFLYSEKVGMEYNLLLKQTLDASKLVNQFRNKLAHGTYVTDKERTTLYILAFATDPVRHSPKNSEKPLLQDTSLIFNVTNELLIYEIAQVNKLRYNIRQLIEKFRPEVLVTTTEPI